jgi:microcystin-dependent protein
MNAFLGSILYFSGNFAMSGTASCAGQILSISQNTALFSLLGTQYGGNGTSTFALPDLRGRGVVTMGQGTGLSPYNIGTLTGTETTTMLLANLPLHNHTMNASTGQGTTGDPTGGIFTAGLKTGHGPQALSQNIYNTTAPGTALAPTAIGFTGGNIPFSILQPYLTVTAVIYLSGVFPQRS